MPECIECGSFVTENYLRVFAPDDLEAEGKVRACPFCTTVRRRGEVRQARSRGASYQRGTVE